MKKLISVIIPIYNVRQFLVKCVTSVINQKYDNLEIILIDDGSDDGSGQICDDFAESDSRVKVFHKENGGLANARNYGLKYATGEYVGFIDSDDYVDEKFYERLIRFMKMDVDIVSSGVIHKYKYEYQRKYTKKQLRKEARKFGTVDAIQELLLMREFDLSVCNKLFKRKLFENISFPDGASSEDVPVIFSLFLKCKAVVNNGFFDYYYVHRSGSITESNFTSHRMDYLFFARQCAERVKNKYPDLEADSEIFIVKVVLGILYQLDHSNNDVDNQEYYEQLKEELLLHEAAIQKSALLSLGEKERAQMYIQGTVSVDIYKKKINTMEKMSEFYEILVQWVYQLEKGNYVSEYLTKHNYPVVSIYGMKELGELLYEGLIGSGVDVAYIIDRNREMIDIEVPVFLPEDNLPEVDAIIVTAVHYYDEIRKYMEERVNCPIISLESILFDD